MTVDKRNAPGRMASLIHGDGEGVAVMVRGVDLKGIVFASEKAAVGSTQAEVISAVNGNDTPSTPLGAAYVQQQNGPSLIVAGDPQIRRLVIETGKRTLRQSGSFVRIPASDLSSDSARPQVSVRGYLADGTVVPAT